MERLTREQIVAALERLNDRLAEKGKRAQLYLVGGAVLCLIHEARTTTRDVDGWFTEAAAVRQAAKEVAEELNLPANWLNDAAKGFIPPTGGFSRWRSFSHLDISAADDRTLLAMKCAAARTEEDAGDIKLLASRLGLTSAADVLRVALSYYPAERLSVRSRLLLEEMFQ